MGTYDSTLNNRNDVTDLNDLASNSGGAIADDVGHGRCWIDLDGADGVTVEDCTGVGTDDGTGSPATGGTSACCTGAGTGPDCLIDDSAVYIYEGVAGDNTPATIADGWDLISVGYSTSTLPAGHTHTDAQSDDEILEGSYNYVYNGSFESIGGNGLVATTCAPCASGDAELPDGNWDVLTGTTPTVTYTDPTTDTRWGEGVTVTVTNAGAANEGLMYTLTNLPSDTLFKVQARAIDDGTAVCTLDVTNEAGAAFTSTATTTDAWETLSGTFGTDAGVFDTVEITLTTTGADTTACTWDHVTVNQIGDVTADRDEIPQSGVIATTDISTTSKAYTGTEAIPDLSAAVTIPTGGWVIKVDFSVDIEADATDADGEGIVEIMENAAACARGSFNIDTNAGGGLNDFVIPVALFCLNTSPVAGTVYTYTAQVTETTGAVSTGTGSNEAKLVVMAYPTR
jgi:hypothetical protein